MQACQNLQIPTNTSSVLLHRADESIISTQLIATADGKYSIPGFDEYEWLSTELHLDSSFLSTRKFNSVMDIVDFYQVNPLVVSLGNTAVNFWTADHALGT